VLRIEDSRQYLVAHGMDGAHSSSQWSPMAATECSPAPGEKRSARWRGHVTFSSSTEVLIPQDPAIASLVSGIGDGSSWHHRIGFEVATHSTTRSGPSEVARSTLG